MNKRKLFHKDDGSMVDFIYVIVALLILSIISILMMNWYSDMDKKTKIEMLGREYILRMETEGFLTDGDKDNLIKNLNEFGVSNISLIGTTSVPVKYGDKIILHMEGKIQISSSRLVNWLHLQKESSLVPIIIHKASTAKN
jgi:hypothetical protein